MTQKILLALLLFMPVSAHATAGFGETHSEVTYNEFAGLHWIHPGDGCDVGNYCFQIRRPGNEARLFEGLEPSLKKVSRPTLMSGPLMMGQFSQGETWFVYDLSAEEFLSPPGPELQALDAWIARDLPAPEFWDARGGGEGLRQTKKSLFENWGFFLFLLAPILLVAGLPLFLVLVVRNVRRYRASKRPLNAVLAVVLVLPALLIVAVFFRVFVPVFWK